MHCYFNFKSLFLTINWILSVCMTHYTCYRKLAKAHTSNGRMLEDAIVSVENAQDKTMKFIDPDKENKEKK